MRIVDIIYLRNYYKDNDLSFLQGIGLRRRSQEVPSYERVLEARDKNQEIYNARSIMGAGRLDMAAKTMFARSYIEGNSSSWPEKVYKEHLRSWNNFYEDQPLKETYEDFKISFLKLIDSFMHNTMKYADSPVIINKVNGILRNGAHRTAAAIATGDLINVVEKDLKKNQLWNADFFRGKLEEKPEFPLDEKYIDAMTIEYVSLKPDNLFAVVIFPSAKGHRTEAERHLESIGRIVNHRSFKHNMLDGESVIRQLYYGEPWNYEGSEGVSNKAGWCFNGEGNLHVYIIESDLNLDERVKEKEYLRSIWGVDKNSIHMTDTADEVNAVTRMFFHEGTVKTLKAYRSFSVRTLERFNQYRSALPTDFIERDKFCIDSSAVLDFFGLREAADIDYISLYDGNEFDIEGVEQHSDEYVRYYPVSKDDMIIDPENHFYYAGCKILTLELVRSMKDTRSKADPSSRDKDIRDLELINKYLSEQG